MSDEPTPDVLSNAVPLRVSVVDVNMPFASMVGFMIKWALAAIPAVFILGMVGLFVFVILGAIGMSIK